MEQYEQSAVRHYANAILLQGANQFDNAGHLLGFSAECAIKHAISSFKPGRLNPKGHFPEYLNIARKHIDARSNMYNLLQQNLMDGWRVDRRYFATGHTTATELNNWDRDARRILGAAGIKGHLV